jgi:hypothetical protein
MQSSEIYLSVALQPFVGPWPIFQCLYIQYIVGRTPWTWNRPVARPLSTRRRTQTQNNRTQTSKLRVGFEPTTPVFEQAKTVHVSDRTATVIGNVARSDMKIILTNFPLLVTTISFLKLT